MYLKTIEAINSKQQSRLTRIKLNGSRLKYDNGPKTKCAGLYWIYAKYSDDDFLKSTPCSKKGSVNFASLVNQHKNLYNICKVIEDDFRLVYNGIGGPGSRGYGGLRERILEEFRGGEGTGSLAIKDSSLNDLSNWRVSYVLWSEIPFPSTHAYREFSKTFEHLWRIHYGWPILCAK